MAYLLVGQKVASLAALMEGLLDLQMVASSGALTVDLSELK